MLLMLNSNSAKSSETRKVGDYSNETVGGGQSLPKLDFGIPQESRETTL